MFRFVTKVLFSFTLVAFSCQFVAWLLLIKLLLGYHTIFVGGILFTSALARSHIISSLHYFSLCICLYFITFLLVILDDR